MERRERAGRGAWVLSGLLALVLGAAAAAAAAEPGGGQSEGIKVHGDWTIEIRNPDGSLASRHEVKNELAGGYELLAGLLSNHYSDPIWFVSLYGPNTTGPCHHEGSPDMWPCHITEPRSPFSGTEYSKNLSLFLPVHGMQQRPDGTLQLSGSATAVHDSSITDIYSEWYVTARNTFGAFTHKALNPAIPVRQGQVIQVRVVFSFS